MADKLDCIPLELESLLPDSSSAVLTLVVVPSIFLILFLFFFVPLSFRFPLSSLLFPLSSFPVSCYSTLRSLFLVPSLYLCFFSMQDGGRTARTIYMCTEGMANTVSPLGLGWPERGASFT